MPEKTRTFDINVQSFPAAKLQLRQSKDADHAPEGGMVMPLESSRRSQKRGKVSRDIVQRLIDWFEDV